MEACLSKIVEIQWLRAIAAGLVVIDHAILQYARSNEINRFYLDLAYFLGDLGVWVFFLISGFIMTAISGGGFGEVGAVKKFFSARFIRVLPLYYLFTLLYFFKDGHELNSLLWSVAFVPYENQVGRVQPIVGQGWTLNFEMFFYFLFGCGLLFTKKAGLLFVFFTVACIAAAHVLLEKIGAPVPILEWSRPPLLLFLVGIGLALLYENLSVLVVAPRAYFLSLASLVALAAGSYAIFVNQSPDARTILAAVIAIVVVVFFLFIRGQVASGWFSKAVGLLGDASYSTYLAHGLALGAFSLGWARFVNAGLAWFVISSAVFATVIGLVCYFLVERKLIFLFRRLMVRKPVYYA
jgi:exopolysaccharide production protein ExoZ